MGHVNQHRKAQWKKTKNKQADFVGMVSFAQQNDGAPCSKSHLNVIENPTPVVSSIRREAPHILSQILPLSSP
jgi:hypothetical protein